MRYEVTCTFSEELVRRVTRRFLWRFLGIHTMVVWIVVAACLVVEFLLGDHGWFVGALGAVLVFSLSLAVLVIVTYNRRSLGALRKMKSRTVHYCFDDAGISVESELASGGLRWHMIEELWRFPEAWLFFVSKGHYSTLPTEGLDDAVKDFIVRRVEDAKAKVR